MLTVEMQEDPGFYCMLSKQHNGLNVYSGPTVYQRLMTQMTATVLPSRKPQSTAKHTPKSQCNTKQLMPLWRYVRDALMTTTTMMMTTTANTDEVLCLCTTYSEHFSYTDLLSLQQD